jgi:hypothetical protein
MEIEKENTVDHQCASRSYIDDYGNTIWKDADGNFHRDDGPAYDGPYGTHWFKHGISHREDGPASIDNDGTKFWRKHGKLHRDDGPAIEHSNGELAWYNEGKCTKVWTNLGEMIVFKQ